MVSPNIVENLVQSLPYKNLIVEAAIGILLKQAASDMTESDKEKVIEHLNNGDVESAAELVEQLNTNNPETDLEEEIERLCDELEGCELDAETPGELAEKAQTELGDYK